MNEPFTTAEDLAAHGGDYVRVSQRDIRRIVTLRSSGSTGAAKRLYFTAGDLEKTVDFFARGMAPFCRPGDRAAILIGNDKPDGLGRLVEEAYRRLDARPTLLGVVADYAEAAAALRALQPDTMVGLPCQLRRLALLCPELRPRSVLLSGDYIAESLQSSLERLWQTVVYAHYGLTESGLGFAVQCPVREGYHIRSGDLTVEIIDPDTGEALPDGCTGEIVFTTVNREAMPLRRYRTGDISCLMPEPCPCGDPRPRLGRILGRDAERRKRVGVYALDELLLGQDWLLDYAAALREDGLTLTVVPAPGCSEAYAAETTKQLLSGAVSGLDVSVVCGEVSPSAAKRTVAV